MRKGDGALDISTKGRYGIRALLDLAVYAMKGNIVTLASIAERQNISEGYLEQIIALLRKAKIVNGVKGPQGGYLLSVHPSQINMLMVLQALEGELFVVKADESGGQDAEIMQQSIVQRLYVPMKESIENACETLSLQDLVDDYLKQKEGNIPMYYI